MRELFGSRWPIEWREPIRNLVAFDFNLISIGDRDDLELHPRFAGLCFHARRAEVDLPMVALRERLLPSLASDRQ